MTENRHSETTKQPDDPRQAGFPVLSIDWELYGRYLEDSDLCEADKIAFIETLWSIMVSFVDMGFRLSPNQEICGEVRPLAGEAAPPVLNLKDTKSPLNQAADGPTNPSSEKGVRP